MELNLLNIMERRGNFCSVGDSTEKRVLGSNHPSATQQVCDFRQITKILFYDMEKIFTS